MLSTPTVWPQNYCACLFWQQSPKEVDCKRRGSLLQCEVLSNNICILSSHGIWVTSGKEPKMSSNQFIRDEPQGSWKSSVTLHIHWNSRAWNCDSKKRCRTAYRCTLTRTSMFLRITNTSLASTFEMLHLPQIFQFNIYIHSNEIHNVVAMTVY